MYDFFGEVVKNGMKLKKTKQTNKQRLIEKMNYLLRLRRKDKYVSFGYVMFMAVEETWLQTVGRKNTKERQKLFSIKFSIRTWKV